MLCFALLCLSCAEAEAELGPDARQAQQTALLQSAFECYFRVLKTLAPHAAIGIGGGARYAKARAAKWRGPSTKHQVLVAALDGIAALGHFVSVDLLHSCVALLQRLIGDAGDGGAALAWPLRVRCLRTCASLLQGEASALHIDPQTLFHGCFSLALQLADMDCAGRRRD